MSKKSKYGNIGQDDLLRYMHGGMSDEERHAMERELQKDLFASEALEGLSTQNIEQVREDLNRLERRLNKRVMKRQSALWIRIAASVAILLSIGTVYLTVFRDMSWRTDRMAVETESIDEAIPKEDPGRPAVPPGVSETDQSGPENVDDREKSEAVPISPVPEERNIPQVDPEATRKTGRDEREAEASIPEEAILADEAAGVETAGAGVIAEALTPEMDTLQFIEMEADADQGLIADEIISEPEEESLEEFALEVQESQSRARSMDMARATALEGAEAARPSAAEPIVSAKKQAIAETDPALPRVIILSDSVSARPEGGMDAFRDYIAANMNLQEGLAADTPAEVILRFNIDAAGRPGEIEIVQTAGESYSREAIRLVQEGADWTISSVNGMPVLENVRLQIVFPNQ